MRPPVLFGIEGEPDRECLGRVAAYATHTGIHEFRMFVGRDAPFTTEQFREYLLKHGREMELPKWGHYPRDRDALVLVATPDINWVHALFWCARRQSLLDCQQGGIHSIVESDFNIKCWIPLKSA